MGTERLMGVSRSGVTYQDTFTLWGIPSEPLPFDYTTDRRGFRQTTDHEIPDVVLLGDSILMSALVPFSKTLTSLIDEELDAAIVNVALIGIGPQKELALLRESVPNLKGKHVVQFVFEGNDLLDSKRFRTSKGEVELDLKSRSFIFPLMMQLQRLSDPVDPVSQKQMGTIGDQHYTFLWDRRSFDGIESEIPLVLETLAATRDVVERAGGRYAVVLVPTKLRVIGGPVPMA